MYSIIKDGVIKLKLMMLTQIEERKANDDGTCLLSCTMGIFASMFRYLKWPVLGTAGLEEGSGLWRNAPGWKVIAWEGSASNSLFFRFGNI